MNTLLEAYQTYFRDFHPILRDMATRGIPIDNSRRNELKELIESDDRRVTEEIQNLVPEEVLSTKQKNGLKRTPKDTTGMVEIEVTLTKEEKCSCLKKNRATCLVCKGAGIVGVGTVLKRWAMPMVFNPNSKQQVIKFMKHLKHPVPKSLKKVDAEGNAADTTEVKELERLWAKTKHPIYPLLIEKRQLTKMMGTYVEGWSPSRDQRIHTTYTFQTGTWQLSCCAPWTPVWTKRGFIEISDVVVGDYVLTHKKRWRKVTDTWVHPEDAMVSVHFSNGHILTCTKSHRLLVLDHGTQKSMANGREHSESSQEVSGDRLSDLSVNGEGVRHQSSYSGVHCSAQHSPSGVQSTESSPIFPVETGRQESDEREEGKGSPQLHRGSWRWIRVSDLLEGWKANVCTSAGNDGCSEAEGSSLIMGRSSHQRRSERQQSGQSSTNNKTWTPRYSLIAAEGSGLVEVEKIDYMGVFPVHDITVEEDESYESCGVFSHNSRSPNLQNGPKRGRSASQNARVEAFNRMQKAEPGHVLINLDYQAFHAQTTACEAGLPDYLRLARIDIHSFVACHLLKLEDRHNLINWSDSDMKEFFGNLKKDKVNLYGGYSFGDYRSRAKACALGVGFGMGPRKLYMQYKEDFANAKEAEGIWNLIMQDLFPGLLKWQNAVKKEAAETGRLISRFGAIRQFHDVEHWDRKSQKMVGGDQAEAAIAFKPAANAFGMIRWAMLRLREQGLDARYNLINTIHDSLTLHPKIEDAQAAIDAYVPIMQAPCPLMIYPGVTPPEGLSVKVDYAMGDSMVECK